MKLAMTIRAHRHCLIYGIFTAIGSHHPVMHLKEVVIPMWRCYASGSYQQFVDDVHG
jgi:hypothetical protein